MDLVCSAKNNGQAYFSDLKLDDISRYLPDIILKLFRKSSSITKVFEVKIQSRDTEFDLVHLSVESTVKKSMRKIDINVSTLFDLHNISTILPPTDDIDVFIIDIDEFYQEYTKEISTSLYDKILTTMPSLKEVTLEIPHAYIQDSSPTTYPFIERATLLATAGEKSQEILDEFSHKFPNLKQLNIYYFCGIWNEELHEYQLTLPEYSLEKLVFDLTPVKLKLEKNSKRRNDRQFIVVKVSVSSNHEQRLYKVSYMKAIIINENDLDAFVFEKDYFCIHITGNSLQRLDVYIRDFVSPFDPKYARRSTYEPCLTLFNNS